MSINTLSEEVKQTEFTLTGDNHHIIGDILDVIPIQKAVWNNWRSFNGQQGINGSNLANESSHNASSENASEFGMILTPNIVGVGNNGNPMDETAMIEYFVNTNKPLGSRVNSTGFWCIGGSVIFPIRVGLHKYVATIENKEFVVYWYDWKGINLEGGFVLHTGSQLSNMMQKFSDIESLQIVKTKVTEEQYRELVFADRFTNLPNFFFAIQKYQEDKLTYKPGTIIKNLDNTFQNKSNFKYFVNDERGNVLTNTSLYYPTLNNGRVPKTFDELESVARSVHLGGGIFDIYIYKYIVSDDSASAALQISKTIEATGGGLFRPIGTSPNTPHNHFINLESLHLLSESTYTMGMSASVYNYSNMVFVQVGGIFQYSTVKSDALDEEVSKAAAAYHKEYLDSNSNKKHTGLKGEDNKVDECCNMVINGGPNKVGILQSLQVLSEYNLTPPVISDSNNHLLRETIEHREHDWTIFNGDTAILHMEFQNKNTDWDHVEGLNFRLDTDNIPYHVLVVDGFDSQQIKIKQLRKALKNKTVNGLKRVWVVTLNDFLQGNDNEFKLVSE
tara:strand:+ start:1047 stop:2726 length:1680 start_codon:yes stop_codon:yes gene_type:complete